MESYWRAQADSHLVNQEQCKIDRFLEKKSSWRPRRDLTQEA
jgi:hypothetical protein